MQKDSSKSFKKLTCYVFFGSAQLPRRLPWNFHELGMPESFASTLCRTGSTSRSRELVAWFYLQISPIDHHQDQAAFIIQQKSSRHTAAVVADATIFSGHHVLDHFWGIFFSFRLAFSGIFIWLPLRLLWKACWKMARNLLPLEFVCA